jgi:iron complex outermembrane receptor protein
MSNFHTRRLRTILLAGAMSFSVTAALADDAQPRPELTPDGKVVQTAQNAQVAANVAATTGDYTSTVETVVTTGTRTKDRTVADSEVPIDVVSSKDFENTGKLNIRDALQQIIPSYNNASGWTGGTGEAIKSASLRGLNSDQTLVLVNGKRRHGHAVVFVTARGNLGSSPVDLDLIPSSAIDHVEVLRDGASSQYGSDAIAGVINIILKKGADANGASITYGQDFNEPGHDNGYGQSGTVTAAQGFDLPNGGSIRFSLDYNNHNDTNSLGPTAPCTSATRAQTCLYPAGDPRETTATRFVAKQGLPKGYTGSIGYDAELPITQDITFYSYATAAHQYSQNFGIFRPAASLQTLMQVYPDGYLPQFIVSTDDGQLVTGVRGSNLLGWDWDLSTSISDTVAKLHNNNDLNPSLGPTNAQVNFRLGDIVAIESTTNFDLSRPVNTGLFDTPLNVALGFEYRYNQFYQTAGDPGSYVIGNYVFPTNPADPNYSAANVGKRPSGGSSGLGGFDPSALGRGNRSNTAVYVDLDQNLTSNLDLGLAGRFEHYTDVGDTLSGKVSARYEFIPGYAIRGSLSNGFRAPSLQEESYSSILPNYVSNPASPTQQILSITRYVPSDSPVARALGATPLKPEKSVDESVGITAQPWDGVNITVDAYQISIKDRILATGSLNNFVPNSSYRTAVASAGGNPDDTYSFFTNAADTRTRGIDFVASYDVDYGEYGFVKYSLAGALTYQKITRLEPTPPVLANSGLSLFDRGRIGDLTLAYPKNRTTLGADWSLGDFGVNLRETYYSRTVSVDTLVPARDSINADALITDLSLRYAFTDNVSFNLGANNLLNKRPSQLNALAQLNYGWWAQNPVYNLTSPYGYNGGFYYGRINFTW